MKGTVTRLCSPDHIRIPDEMLSVEVNPAAVEDALRRLSLRYAAQTHTRIVEKGDVVICRADAADYPDGRGILLYTGLDIPGAEEAVRAVLGQQVGASFSAALAGRTVRLTITENVRLCPAEITDGLVASIGLEDVLTVVDYRRYTREKLRADQSTEKCKLAVGWLVTQMLEGSTFAYDEAALEAYLSAHMAEYQAECEADGVEISEAEIRSGMIAQFRQGWLAEAYCQHCGIGIDQSAVAEQTDQMLEMMQLMGENVPDRETVLEDTRRSAYCIEMFAALEKRVKAKMGG